MQDIDALIVHDNNQGEVIAETLQEKYSFDPFRILLVPSIRSAQSLFEGRLHPPVVICHKDIHTDGQDIHDLVRIIRASEGGESIRLCFASQEFVQEEVCKTALELGADIGWDPTSLNNKGVPDWVVAMIRLGYVQPQELPLRHQEIVLSRETANKRLELLGRPPIKERMW